MMKTLSLALSALIAASGSASAAARAAAALPRASLGLNPAAAGAALAAPSALGLPGLTGSASLTSLAPSVLPTAAVSPSANVSAAAASTGVSESATALNAAPVRTVQASASAPRAAASAAAAQSAQAPAQRSATAKAVAGMSASVAKAADGLSGASAAGSHAAGNKIDAVLRGEKFFDKSDADETPNPDDAAFDAVHSENGAAAPSEGAAAAPAEGKKTVTLQEAAAQVKQFAEAFRREFAESIIGEHDLREALLLALLAEGNVLLEGLPGTGKTRSVNAVSQMTDLDFKRIQFQPDTAPSDITGQVELDRKTGAWALRKGPIFTNILLADEINRTTPKTQAALLEGMQEGRVTIAGVRHDLPKPFFVLATQNPIDEEGTFPLPHAQLDRFMFKVDAPYANEIEMAKMIELLEKSTGVRSKQVTSRSGLRFAQKAARAVKVGEEMRAYIARVVAGTRPETASAPEIVKKAVRVGASPRSAWLLTMAAKAHAAAAGRTSVIPEDVQAVAYWTLGHRLVLNFEAAADGVTAKQILQAVFEPKQGVPVTKLEKKK